MRKAIILSLIGMSSCLLSVQDYSLSLSTGRLAPSNHDKKCKRLSTGNCALKPAYHQAFSSNKNNLDPEESERKQMAANYVRAKKIICNGVFYQS